MLHDTSAEPIISPDTGPFPIVSGVILTVSVLFMGVELSDPYTQFGAGMLMVVILNGIICAMWLSYWLGASYTLYADRIVRSRFSRDHTYYMQDLIALDEERSSDDDSLTEIRLSFPGRTITLSENMKAYHEFLTAGQFHKSRIRGGWGRTIIGWVLFIFLILSVKADLTQAFTSANKGTEVYELKNVLTTEWPEAHRSDDGDRGEVRMQLLQVPEMTFFSHNDTIIAYYTGLAKYNAVTHDTLSMELLRYDYETKIAHTREPTFWDRHLDWYDIHIRSARSSHFDISTDERY